MSQKYRVYDSLVSLFVIQNIAINVFYMDIFDYLYFIFCNYSINRILNIEQVGVLRNMFDEYEAKLEMNK